MEYREIIERFEKLDCINGYCRDCANMNECRLLAQKINKYKKY